MSRIRFNNVRYNILHNDNFFFTLLRTGASAQFCGWIDMLASFALFAFLDLTPWLSTALGAFIGGICNCVINYRFVFHAKDKNVSWRAVLVKFMLVWTGSLLLNSFGTQILYYMVRDWEWLRQVLGMGNDAIFLGARLLVSLIVSLGWNFVLQRCFVFRTTRLDPTINNIWKAIAAIWKKKYNGNKA